MRAAAREAIVVRVRLFARARELAGGPELTLEIPAGAGVRDAVRLLAEIRPGLGPLLERCRFAVGESYVAPEDRLREGDELAVIPPTGGG